MSSTRLVWISQAWPLPGEATRAPVTATAAPVPMSFSRSKPWALASTTAWMLARQEPVVQFQKREVLGVAAGADPPLHRHVGQGLVATQGPGKSAIVAWACLSFLEAAIRPGYAFLRESPCATSQVPAQAGASSGTQRLVFRGDPIRANSCWHPVRAS